MSNISVFFNKKNTVITAFFILLYIVLVCYSNFHFVDDYALFMDERITYDGVEAIYNAKDNKVMQKAIYDGGDQRYGRILWNSMAFFSYIPTEIWGSKGQIISGRLFQALLLLLSYLLLTYTFLDKKISRVIGLAFLLYLPYTPYYASMPKPEPQQLFTLSLFLFYAYKNDFRVGWYWIFLGLTVGAKISGIPIALFFLGLILIRKNKPKSIKTEKNKKKKASAVQKGNTTKNKPPKKIEKKGSVGNRLGNIVKAILLVMAGWIIAVPLMFKGIMQKLGVKYDEYANDDILANIHQNIFGNVASKELSIIDNTINWGVYLFTDWSYLFLPLMLVLILVYIYLFGTHFLDHLKAKKSFQDLLLDKAVLAFIVANSFSLVIFLKIERLWGFYHHFGSVFLVLSALVIVEHKQFRGILKDKVKIGLFVLAGISIGNLIFGSYMEYNKLAQRADSPEHQKREKQYKITMDLVDRAYAQISKSNSQAKVFILASSRIYQPSLYFEKAYFRRCYNTIFWGMGAHYVILERDYSIPPQKDAPQKEMNTYLTYKKFVAEAPKTTCNQNVCYKEILRDTSLDLYIYQRIK